MDILADARQLADFIVSLHDFRISSHEVQSYNHMGATITDSILQAGVNYRTVVEPRVKHVLREYPVAKTSPSFLDVIDQHGVDFVLNWRHPEKPRRVRDLTIFFVKLNVETEADLKYWLLDSDNCQRLLDLKGIGPKTVDYMKRLVGISTIAVDRHMRRFINLAGVKREAYDEIQIVVAFAADLLKISRSNLDSAIWLYSSEIKNFKQRTMTLH
jgi:hypothetical protein